MKAKINTSDLMLGDVIAFKNKYGKVTPPYEVEALEKDYVRALLLYRNDDTPSDEFNLDGKDGDEIVDVELTEKYISERFEQRKEAKKMKDVSEYVLSETLILFKKDYFYVLRNFHGEFYVLKFFPKGKGVIKHSYAVEVKTVREFQKELKKIKSTSLQLNE